MLLANGKELANEFGISRPRVREILMNVAPAEVRKRVNYYRILDFCEARYGKEKTGQLQLNLDDEKTQEQIRKLKIENDEKEGLLVPKSRVIETLLPTLTQIRQLLKEMLINQQPPAIENTKAEHIRSFNQNFLDDVFGRVSKLGNKLENL